MSYASLVNQSSASIAETFQRIRDFICKRNGTYNYSTTGIGWTLHDSVYAVSENSLTTGDYVVFKSTGENTKHDLYFRMTLTATGMTIAGFLYWNNSTHAGIRQYNSTENITPTASTTFDVNGNLDAVVITYDNSTTHYCMAFGRPSDGEGFYNNSVAISSSAVSTGTNVVVTVDSVPASWYVGQKLYHWDTAAVNVVTIGAIGSGQITLSSVGTSKLANNKLSADMGYFCASSLNFGTFVVLADRSTGTATVSATSVLGPNSASFLTSGGVDSFNSKRPSEYIPFGASTSHFGVLPHLRYPITTSLTHRAPVQDQNGVNWRSHLAYRTVLVREA